MAERPSRIAAIPVNRKRATVRVPWELFVALGLYALGVLGYIWGTYWRTPEYQAAEHYLRARALLDPDDGKTAPAAQVLSGLDELLEASRLVPRVRALHDKIEQLRWQLDARHLSPSKEQVLRAEAVAAIYERARQEQEPILVVGVRNRGWAPDQLEAGPGRAVLWSLPGGALIIVLWAVWRYGPKRTRAEDHESELQGIEDEVERLAGHRASAKSDTQRPSRQRPKL